MPEYRTVTTIVGHILIPTTVSKAAINRLTKPDLLALLSGDIPEAAAALGIVKG